MNEKRVKIKAHKVKKRFASTPFTSGVTALEEINMEVHEGEFAALIGPSGCGKSTFLYIVAGFEKATAGEVQIDGRPVTRPGPDRGIVFQEYVLFPWLTVAQNITFGLEIQCVDKAGCRSRCHELLQITGLSGFENNYPHTLSGGMQQRVAIARALAYDPEVLLMDEPFGALDAQTKRRMIADFVHLWESLKKTVLFVTHSVEEALMLADTIFLFSFRPSRIKDVFRIDLARPRDMSNPRFVQIQKEIMQSLDEEVEKMMRLELNAEEAKKR
ncbi:MAG: ABC transporter ATP-binding protein [Deltaproteobacteria bacterium]|nr:ABC transporter ATP-binding protein [Deltaproteobacteria bacterium]